MPYTIHYTLYIHDTYLYSIYSIYPTGELNEATSKRINNQHELLTAAANTNNDFDMLQFLVCKRLRYDK